MENPSMQTAPLSGYQPRRFTVRRIVSVVMIWVTTSAVVLGAIFLSLR